MHEIIKLVATYGILISLLGFAVVCIRISRSSRLQFLATLIAAGVTSFILAKIASSLYNDPRPFVQGHFTPLLSHAADNGFPSDHTLLAAVLAFVALQHSRKIGSALLVVGLAIGLARMAAGVHHSWDILGSFVCAAIGVWTAQWLLKRYWGVASHR